MTTYRLCADCWVPYVLTPGKWKKYYADQVARSSPVPDPDKWKKYFAAQIAGRPPPEMSPIKQKEEPVVVKLVSGVQDAVDRANATIKHKQKIEKQGRAVQKYDLMLPARKQSTVEKTFQYRTNEQKKEKQMRTVQDNEKKIPARKQRKFVKAFQYWKKQRGTPYKKLKAPWNQTKYNMW